MKALSYFIALLYLTNIYTSCFGQKHTENINLKKVEMLDSRIDSLLNVVINTAKGEVDLNKCILELGLLKQDSDYYVSIIIYGRNIYNLIYHSHNQPLQGYYSIQNQTVLIVGNIYSQKMSFTDQIQEYSFPDIANKSRKKYPPPPPPIYDPIVVVYLLKNTGEVFPANRSILGLEGW